MRFMKIGVLLVACLVTAGAFGQLKKTTEAIGYAQYTSLGSAISLSSTPASGIALPTDNNRRPLVAIITVGAQAVRWRDDGTAPTASVGMPLAAGDSLVYDGPLNQLQFIEQAAGARLNVSYYR